MQAVGIKIVNEQALPISTLSYDAAARGVANSKADYLFYPAAGNLNASDGPVDVRHRLQAEVPASTSPPTGRTSSSWPAPPPRAPSTWIRALPTRGARRATPSRTRSSTGWRGSAPGRDPGHLRRRRVGGGQGVLRQPERAARPDLARRRSSPSSARWAPTTEAGSSARSSWGRSSATAASSACRSSAASGSASPRITGSSVDVAALRLARARGGPGAEARPSAPLALHGVGAAYGRIEVVHGVDIAVRSGGVTALLGPERRRQDDRRSAS